MTIPSRQSTTTTTTSPEVTATSDLSVSCSPTSPCDFCNLPFLTKLATIGYYMSPTFDTLTSMSKEELKQVQNLVVGRTGFGEVRYEQTVDLSDVDLRMIMGIIISIEDRKVTIYPYKEYAPPKGLQLDVPATITMENYFSRDRYGNPIKDPTHSRFIRYKEKIRKHEGVEFIDYTDNGEWTFKVQGAS